METTTKPKLLLSDIHTHAYLQAIGNPCPHSVSTLRKDRSNGCLGHLPYYKIGGLVRYCPDDVIRFFSEQAVIAGQKKKIFHKTKFGRPGNVEIAEAIKAGFVKRSGKADVSKFRQAVRDGGVAGKAVQL